MTNPIIEKKEVAQCAPEFIVANKSTITRTKRKGTVVREIACAVYDVAVDGGAIGAHTLGVFLPAKAIITDAWIDVVTTFADGVSDAATIAASVESAGDLVAAIAISDASNVWDAGIHGTKVTAPNLGADAAHDSQLEVVALTAATKIKTTAVREITMTTAGVILTAGKANVFVEYVISD